MRVSKKAVDIIFGLLGVGLAMAAWYFSRNFPRPLDGHLGAAVFPRIVGVLIGCTSVAIIVGAFARDRGSALVFNHSGRVAVAFAVTLAYSLILPHAGFLVVTPLYLAIVMVLAGSYSKFRIVVAALGVTVLLYISFKILLDSPLPDGFLFAPDF